MKFGVLVSGNGTNLQALLDAEARGDLAPATIAVVISSRPNVPALARAAAAGKPTEIVDHKLFADRDAFEARILAALAHHRVDAVVLAGFMRILSAKFVEHFPLRMINTHPSLLPAFPGTDATAKAIGHGVKISGVTIHFVDASLDGGPIITQASVPVFSDDDAATLQARIQIEEHRILPDIVRALAAGTITCVGRRVTLGGVDS